MTVTIGPSEGSEKLSKKQAERFAYEHYLKPLDTSVVRPLSTMTVGQYWDQKYEPALRKSKKHATQIQYVSLWKQWLKPAVEKIRLFELRPEHIDQSISGALRAGKSTATAKHIRKVASAIWSHAKRMQCASGDNPAQAVEQITVEPVRKIRPLTAEQCRRYLAALPEPAQTMCLMSVAVSMNVSELLGLEEDHLNFSDQWKPIGIGDAVPPHHIAVRRHRYIGRGGTLKTGKRKRNLPMPPHIEQALARLIMQNRNRGPESPVFQTREGTAQWADNLASRVLKKTAAEIGLHPVSWHVLRHTHATLTKSVGMSDYDRMQLMGHGSVDMTDRYTHEDRERVRAGVDAVMRMIFADDFDQQLTSKPS
jgi:integrase